MSVQAKPSDRTVKLPENGGFEFGREILSAVIHTPLSCISISIKLLPD